LKITSVRTIKIDRCLYVQVETDNGIIGVGESGAWAFLEASEAVIKIFREYLIGKDPLQIEHHWQYMYRCFHFRGAAIMGAISAIDIALWDIEGKFFNTPVYQLLGGKCRNKARVYLHVFGKTKEELIRSCISAKERGYTAVGHLNPFLDEPRSKPFFKTHFSKIQDAIDTIRHCREAVGSELDLCVEIHRRLKPSEAITLARGIEEYRPLFFEDPIPPDNFDALEFVANKINIPIATGERLHTIHEFEMLLKRGAVQYIRPDICLAGGITHCKKIAALAEAYYVDVVPHNPLGPVSLAACIQVAAAIPNFALQEYPEGGLYIPAGGVFGDNRPAKMEIVKDFIEVRNGYIIIPDKPGIGVELLDDAERKYPFKQRPLEARLHEDGSVIDQ